MKTAFEQAQTSLIDDDRHTPVAPIALADTIPTPTHTNEAVLGPSLS